MFYQGNDINSALGLLVLDRRVIVSRSPHVFVLTDTDGDDRADRKEVLFSGIEGEQHDHGVHAFVFGPDGKLYFNMGNEGKVLKDASGRVVRDVFGKEVKAEGHPYHQGMIFRCNLDGSGFEVLAHNFRNNYAGFAIGLTKKEQTSVRGFPKSELSCPGRHCMRLSFSLMQESVLVTRVMF